MLVQAPQPYTQAGRQVSTNRADAGQGRVTDGLSVCELKSSVLNACRQVRFLIVLHRSAPCPV